MDKLSRHEALALSQPHLTGFSPYVIPYQGEVVNLIRRDWDYSKGTPEILLSGSYGSSKSVLMAHLAVTHCLFYPKARVCLARRALPDLKRTIFQEIIEHIETDLVEGKDYTVNQTQASIKFKNGSEIISISWADKKYKKGRSLKLSALIFEELTENSDEDFEAFATLKARLRRLPDIKENFLIAATNPDSPRTVWYKYFIQSQPHDTRFVFYSVTFDNPFLDPVYIEQLKRDMDEKSAKRYIYGQWIELAEDSIYYEYNPAIHFKKNEEYKINKQHPILLAFDFNIGQGKPMSSAAGQYINGVFHWFDKVVVEGSRTLDQLESWLDKGIFGHGAKIVIHGDATGQARDTRSILSDYDIIKRFMAQHNINYQMLVPRANPPIRTRHNRVNTYFKNALGEHRMFIYKGCDIIDEGFRLTAFKKGSDTIEDDSKSYQHITTAIGYAVVYQTNSNNTLNDVNPNQRIR